MKNKKLKPYFYMNNNLYRCPISAIAVSCWTGCGTRSSGYGESVQVRGLHLWTVVGLGMLAVQLRLWWSSSKVCVLQEVLC